MNAWLELGGFVAVLTVLTPLLGAYIAAVFTDERIGPRRLGGLVESWIYRFCGIDAACEMSWQTYLAAAVTFSFVSAGALFVLLLTQQWLPLNPQHFSNLPPLLALNVAISFMTTTNWQAYSGETTLSYLS